MADMDRRDFLKRTKTSTLGHWDREGKRLGALNHDGSFGRYSAESIHCFTGSYKLLVEATLDQVKNRLQIWTKQYFDGIESEALRLLPDIIAADPTNGKYSEWLIRQYKNGNARFPEDSEKLRTNLESFHKKKSKLAEKDLNKYTPAGLAKALEQKLGLTKSEVKQARKGKLFIPPGAESLFDNGKIQVVKVTETDAASKLANGTEWCVVNEDMARSYLSKGPLYFVYINGKRKVLVHYETEQFKNVYDEEISRESRLSVAKILEPFTGKNKDNYALLALDNAKIERERNKQAEILIINEKSPKFAYEYAKDVIGKRWPEAEDMIIKDPSYAVLYARDVIEGSWPELENAFEADSFKADYLKSERAVRAAADYAMMVRNKRWTGSFQKVENQIRNSPSCDDYAKHFKLDPQKFCLGIYRRKIV